jgi:hypothetical protein
MLCDTAPSRLVSVHHKDLTFEMRHPKANDGVTKGACSVVTSSVRRDRGDLLASFISLVVAVCTRGSAGCYRSGHSAPIAAGRNRGAESVGKLPISPTLDGQYREKHESYRRGQHQGRQAEQQLQRTTGGGVLKQHSSRELHDELIEAKESSS